MRNSIKKIKKKEKKKNKKRNTKKIKIARKSNLFGGEWMI
jgi:hypothetical protein